MASATCASCSGRTLSVLIDGILANRLQTIRITPQRLPRPGFAPSRRAYHRTPTRHHDASLKSFTSHQSDDIYVPFDSSAVPQYTLSTHTDPSSLPGPFTRPPVPEPASDIELATEHAEIFEPDIEIQDQSKSVQDEDVREAERSMAQTTTAPVRRVDHVRKPADRLQRKERNREKIAMRRHARAHSPTSEALPEPDVAAKELKKPSTSLQVNTRKSTPSKAAQMKLRFTATAKSLKAKAAAQSTEEKVEPWRLHKAALQAKFREEGWNPRKRLSPEALEGIRALHAQYPDHFSTPALAEQFKVSPEAIRRILKSKWKPNEEEEQQRLQRWDRRGENIWTQKVEQGVHPPKRWREMGIGGGPRRAAQGRSIRPNASTGKHIEKDAPPEERAWIGSLAAGMA